jgi:hypothetical protein
MEAGSDRARLVPYRRDTAPHADDFDRVIESIITLGEQILINLFEKFRMAPMIVLAEIPVEKRRADNPIRLMVTATGHPPA